VIRQEQAQSVMTDAVADALNDEESDGPDRPLRRSLERLSQILALAGGAVFLALVAMSIVSIVGRKLFSAPIQGDVELLQMGAAIGAAAFLPYCEIRDRHIKVEVLSGWMPAGIRIVAHLALAVMALMLTWRTGLQTLDIRASGEVSTLLSVPIWIPVALLVPSFALLTVNAVYRSVLVAPGSGVRP